MDVLSSRFRSGFLSLMQDYLYGGFHGYFQEQVEKISILHAKKNRTENIGFRYKGKRYRSVPKTLTPRLDKDLYPMMDALLKEQETMEWEEQPKVYNALRHGLMLCKVPKDLLIVFPKELHTIIRKSSFDFDELEKTVKPHEAMVFHTQHQEAFEMIRNRIMMNMVLN